MSPGEFDAAWEHMLSKLTHAEVEMLESALRGAEVAHSLAFMAAAFLIGGAAGVALSGLL
jgi:hypothetical protein